MNGKVNGNPQTASFTLSALQIRKVSLNKKKVEFEADRYALHFSGALPYEDDSKAFDKVKISSKPVHIAIDRELVIVPKKVKEKEKDKKKKNAPSAAATSTATATATAAAPATPPAPAIVLPPGTTLSPAHSAMVLNAALDKIFASDIDEQMVARLPDYWQDYFKSKQDHHEFEPSSPAVLTVGGDVAAPKVLNSIDPTSNQYAQKYGIAGMTMFRTVVDSTGKPEEVAISRPIGFGLDEKAVEAIKASHFQPATKDGKPVPVVIDIVVTFRIYSNRTKPGSVAKGSKETQVVATAWDADK
jgi:TonB family protein